MPGTRARALATWTRRALGAISLLILLVGILPSMLGINWTIVHETPTSRTHIASGGRFDLTRVTWQARDAGPRYAAASTRWYWRYHPLSLGYLDDEARLPLGFACRYAVTGNGECSALTIGGVWLMLLAMTAPWPLTSWLRHEWPRARERMRYLRLAERLWLAHMAGSHVCVLLLCLLDRDPFDVAFAVLLAPGMSFQVLSWATASGTSSAARALILGSYLLPFLAVSLWRVRPSRSERRRAAGQCVSCGYDLRATPERCPECGTVTAPEKVLEQSRGS